MYVIKIDVWTGKAWTTEVFRKGYETLEQATKAFEYLTHHDSELASKLSIREA